MIKSLIFLTFLLILNFVSAQQIVEMEYFFNSDPGFGNGISLPFTNEESINILNEIDVSSLETGCHVLYFRCKNENGGWSFTQQKNFYRLPNPAEIPTITKIEYSFAPDFPQENTFEHSITSAPEINEIFTIDLDQLTIGFHTIFVRLTDENSAKSFTQAKTIFKSNEPTLISEITEIKYFFQLDESDAVILYPEPSTSVEEQFEVSLSELDFGFHKMYFQVKNTAGVWSMRYSKPIFKEKAEIAWNIARLEWYFSGSDANEYSIFTYDFSEQTISIEDAFDISLLHLAQGNEYVLHLVAIDENNNRSLEQQFSFTQNFIPRNLDIYKTDDIVFLDWDEIIGATNYKIFSSDLPDSGFQFDTSGTFNGTTWQTSISQWKKFYYVIAEKEESNFVNMRKK